MVGIVLPGAGTPFETELFACEHPLLQEGVKCSLWLRDWPAKGVNGDIATGWDALTYAGVLIRDVKHLGLDSKVSGIGFGAIRIDRYDSLQLARSIVTLGAFAKSANLQLRIGLTFGPASTLSEIEVAYSKWQQLNAALDGKDHRFELPRDWVRPSIYLCSDSEDKWRLVRDSADGWLTSEYRPSILAKGIEHKRRFSPGMACILQLRAGILVEQQEDVQRDDTGQLWFSVAGLRKSVSVWKDIGVEEVVLWPNPSSTEESIGCFLQLGV